MYKRYTKVTGKIVPEAKLIRTAAYARVSSDKDAMLNSLSAQVSYYSALIQAQPEWQYVRVYADEARTGTKDNRPEFQRLLEDCRSGLIDQILVKSISRFARNTVTLLETVRELTALGIDVFFQRENIHTLSADGELMLTLIAAIAQEESRSVSENCKWRIRNDYEHGISHGKYAYGYRCQKGTLVIEPSEAAVVQLIFAMYIGGRGARTICRMLDELGAIPPRGRKWDDNAIIYIITNERYIGDVLLQKTYVQDHITKRQRRNKGELPQYYATDAHPAIVDRECFEAAQRELATRRERFAPLDDGPSSRPFTGMIRCTKCAKHYKYTSAHGRGAWNCSTFVRRGKQFCHAIKIRDDILRDIAAEVLELTTFDDDAFRLLVERIDVPEPYRLVFHLRDGQIIERDWEVPSRSDSWDEDARARAREQVKARCAH